MDPVPVPEVPAHPLDAEAVRDLASLADQVLAEAGELGGVEAGLELGGDLGFAENYFREIFVAKILSRNFRGPFLFSRNFRGKQISV